MTVSQGNFVAMFTYVGDPGRVYSAISVDGHTLEPVPGQHYDIDDPGDGRWEPSKGSPVVVAPEVDENASEVTTGATEEEVS